MASNTISIELTNEKINQLIDFYNDDKITSNNQYIVFAAKNENCTIAVYSSNKVVFQGKNAFEIPGEKSYNKEKRRGGQRLCFR